ncbi:AAA family ATPase [Lentisphaerota bacterium WC36G]|nr:AAA family ATPase [Lentisphaerae bacterium WC36]
MKKLHLTDRIFLESGDCKNLDKTQQYAMLRMFQGQNVFLTGEAGSGKSHVVKLFLENTRSTVTVIAPTGTAALNINGRTMTNVLMSSPVHFKFKLGNKCKNSDSIPDKIFVSDIILIDEISMIRMSEFEILDKALRKFTGNLDQSFGGKQIIVVGDFCQLQPVYERKFEFDYYKRIYGGEYIFQTDMWRDANFENIFLNTIHRQNDNSFKEILNELRFGVLTENNFNLLAKRFKPLASPDDKTICLCPTIKQRDKFNALAFKDNPEPAHTFNRKINGSVLKPNVAPLTVKLKNNQKVMVNRNIYDGDSLLLVNGDVGVIKNINEDTNAVEIDFSISKEDHKFKRITLFHAEWSEWANYAEKMKNSKYKHKSAKLGSIRQMPLVSAYALTIHKAQGKTLEKVHITNDNFFAPYQFYTALSRAKCLDDITLEYPLSPDMISVDYTITEFYQNLQTANITDFNIKEHIKIENHEIIDLDFVDFYVRYCLNQ